MDMDEITRILNASGGDEQAAMQELLPAVYERLRSMARAKMANEAHGHTLQATALVHEAWLRLSGAVPQTWANRAHFFAAAAEAIRRILVDYARRKNAQKRGSGLEPEEFEESSFVLTAAPDELLAVNEALDELAKEDPVAAELVKLRYFVGMNMVETAEALNLAPRTAERLWSYARAWLKREMREGS